MGSASRSDELDGIFKKPGLGGELSIILLCVMKKLLSGNIVGKEFAPEEMGQAIAFEIKVMNKQPWHSHIYAVLSDTRRFKSFKITRNPGAVTGFHLEHSHIFMDVTGWGVLRRYYRRLDSWGYTWGWRNSNGR